MAANDYTSGWKCSDTFTKSILSSNIYTSATSASTATTSNQYYDWSKIKRYNDNYKISLYDESLYDGIGLDGKIPKLKKTYSLPDGSKLLVDDNGNYTIEDKDAKITYRANRNRDFSPHINASDMLAQFVEYVGTLGVKKSEVMGLPIHLFISWLIIEAANRDGDNIPQDIIPINKDPFLVKLKNPKCLDCGRYIPQLHNKYQFPFCDPNHGNNYLKRQLQLIEKPQQLICSA